MVSGSVCGVRQDEVKYRLHACRALLQCEGLSYVLQDLSVFYYSNSMIGGAKEMA